MKKIYSKHKNRPNRYKKNKNRMLFGKTVRLVLTAKDKVYISKMCGTRRFVYNYLLACVQNEHKRLVENINAAYENYIYYNEPIPEGLDLNGEYCPNDSKIYNSLINELKQQEEYKWIKDTPAKVIQQAITDLWTAFCRFFKGLGGYPTFKKKTNDDSCRFIEQAIKGGQSPTGIKCFNGNRFTLNKTLADVLFKCSRKDEKYLNKYQNLIHNITLTKTKTKKYYAKVSIELIEKAPEKTGACIALDMGIKDFCVDSNGNVYGNLHWLKSCMKRIKRLQKSLARKQKDSKNYEKTRLKLAKLHEYVKNARKDHHDKLSTQLVKENDVICVEDLNIKGMMQNHNLAESIQELAWGEFINMLEYKCKRYDKILVKVDRFYPSSKLCNNCGYKKKDLCLSDREWICPDCGAVIDRDINAAKNILDEGLRILQGNC